MQQENFQFIGVETEGSHSRLDAGNVAVVVGAPKIYQLRKAALEFILVVSNVSRQIGWHAVFTNNNAVFVVAVLRRRQPERAVLFVNFATVAQSLNGGVDFIWVQSAFAVPNVEGNLELS